MQKINGYTEDEARGLVAYIQEGKRKGKTLTYLFEAYGLQHGRAKGSVRNYYYTLMKNEGEDERIVKLLDGTDLSVERIREFSDEEATAALKSILLEKSKGVSVRRAIFNLSKGDDKLSLRLQNKYRNTLKKQPERLAELAKSLGLNEDVYLPTKRHGKCDGEQTANGAGNALLRRRLEQEINGLYERLAQGLKAENERLRVENGRLKAENSALKQKGE